MTFSQLPCYLVPLMSKYSPQNILSLRSSLSVSDQVSHPYKTRDKIIVLYVLKFKLFNYKINKKISFLD
jgi:hypothetical protein